MKILLFDIENSPNTAYVWGKYEQNVIAYEQEWYMLCFAYKWFGEKQVKVHALNQYDGYEKDKTNDFYLVNKLWQLFDEADVIIGHNGDNFDIKKANARFLYHNLTPPSPYKTIDTLKLARKYFKMNANRLDDVAAYLNVGRKVVNEGWPLWKGCMDGDPKAWARMKAYNKQDVVLLDEVYQQLRPWMHNHPNINEVNEDDKHCPVCQSEDIQRRGFDRSASGATQYQRYRCMACGKWSRGPSTRTNIQVR